jgi:hypothetical protein
MRILGKQAQIVDIDGQKHLALRFGILILTADIDAVSIWLGSFGVGCSAIRVAVDTGYKTEEEADQWFRSNLVLIQAGLTQVSNLIWGIDI